MTEDKITEQDKADLNKLFNQIAFDEDDSNGLSDEDLIDTLNASVLEQKD